MDKQQNVEWQNQIETKTKRQEKTNAKLTNQHQHGNTKQHRKKQSGEYKEER